LFVSGRRAPQRPDPHSPIHRLPDLALVEALQRRYDGLPKVLLRDPDMLHVYLRIIRADLELVETYAYTTDEPLACPISAFGGLYDRLVSHTDIAAWREHTSSSFLVRILPGSHFYLNGERARVVQHIASDMDKLTLTSRFG
jgi:medium-chain acyl-[acyl-carrier-protein] hydrolase